MSPNAWWWGNWGGLDKALLRVLGKRRPAKAWLAASLEKTLRWQLGL